MSVMEELADVVTTFSGTGASLRPSQPAADQSEARIEPCYRVSIPRQSRGL